MIRVVTWNLWAFDTDRATRRDRIVNSLRAIRPDLCCLQEVRSDDREDFARTLSETLDLSVQRTRPVGVEWWRSRLGDETALVDNVLLSRWPTSEITTLQLPAEPGGREERSALFARVETPTGPVLCIVTQLSSSPLSSALRSRQVRAISQGIAERRRVGDVVLLGGDLNAEPDSDEVRLLCGHKTPPAAEGVVLLDAWRFAEHGNPGWTWDRRNPYVAATGEPDSRIDYILLGPTASGRLPSVHAVEVAACEEPTGAHPSDHRAVVADFALPGDSPWR